MLPEDREGHRFNQAAKTLDMSRVQLAANLDAADAADVALRQVMASGQEPPSITKYPAIGTQLFSGMSTFGEREAMFFAKDIKAVETKELETLKDYAALELALFRSAHWPYFGYPQGFVARQPGEYRLRFSARAILQTGWYQLKPATEPVPMTIRARKPPGPDVSGDVRATGGIIDSLPEPQLFETISGYSWKKSEPTSIAVTRRCRKIRADLKWKTRCPAIQTRIGARSIRRSRMCRAISIRCRMTSSLSIMMFTDWKSVTL